GTTVVLGVATLRIRAGFGVVRISVDGKEIPPPPPKGPLYDSLADRDANVADALRALAQPDEQLDWYDLYKVFEIVREAVGGQKDLIATKWFTSADVDRFTASANHPGLSGDEARHARQGGRPPDLRKAMSLAEANGFIQRLVVSWIESHPDYGQSA
ncbi:MAG TPA: hypothetical protein VE442_22625, partial [Jatrophihabitans sp.]|nr:hypothetical protein [Jatrophihabitans sp.]